MEDVNSTHKQAVARRVGLCSALVISVMASGVPAANAQDDPEPPDEEKVLGEGQAVDEPESGEDVANDEDADDN